MLLRIVAARRSFLAPSAKTALGAACLGLCLLIAAGESAPAQPADQGRTAVPQPEGSIPGIVPWPKSLDRRKGQLNLTTSSRIAIADPSLRPLALLLSQEIGQVYGLTLKVTSGTARKGDVLLALDPSLRPESYVLDISHTVTIRGATYNAIAFGTVSLLQAMSAHGNKVTVPCMSVNDTPYATYRGVLVDVARRWHSIETLRQIVILCRYYKIRYLQLHLTDNESFTFPSGAYPELATAGRHYSLTQLQELEQFARQRGVTIVPELEVPGHSAQMSRLELFRRERQAAINMTDEAVFVALDRIVGEICEVFQSTPYFHIGGDEVSLKGVGETPAEKAYMEKFGLADAEDIYLHFITRMNRIVRKYGKTTLVWEGFKDKGSERVRVPEDMIVLAFETLYQRPDSLIRNGYTVINSSWKPLYITPPHKWDPEYIYGWNMFRWENWWDRAPSYVPIQLEPAGKVIGAEMCSWEMPEEMELPELRTRVPAFSERLWHPGSGLTYENFRRRFLSTDARLTNLTRLNGRVPDAGGANRK
jgi:hexosaminidase